MDRLVYFMLLMSICVIENTQIAQGDESSTKKGFACEGSTLTIDCGVDTNKKIYVVRANYGRQNIAICNDGSDTSGWNLQCTSIRAPKTVSRICDKQIRCIVPSDNKYFGDPCYLTPKYLEVQFECREEISTIPPPVFELNSTTTVITTPVTTTTTTTMTTTTTISTTTASPPTSTTKSIPTKPSIPATKPTKPTPPAMLFTTTTEPMQHDDSRPKQTNYCETDYVRGIKWPKTYKGSWAIMDCPNNPGVRKAMRKCDRHIVDWDGPPNLSGCNSPEVEDLAKKMARAKEEFSEEIVTEVANDLEHASVKEDLLGGDLKMMSIVMKDMVSEMNTQSKNVSKPVTKKLIHDVAQSVLNTSSNILDESKKDSWTDLPQATQAETATRVISAVEESAYQMADTYEHPAVVVNVTLNIVLEVNIVDTSSDHVEDVIFPKATSASDSGAGDWMKRGNSIRLPGNALKQLGVDGLARLIFLTYNNLERWLHPQHVPMAASFGGRHVPTDDNYQEFKLGEPDVFDPDDIEMEIRHPDYQDYPVHPVDLGDELDYPADPGRNNQPELANGKLRVEERVEATTIKSRVGVTTGRAFTTTNKLTTTEVTEAPAEQTNVSQLVNSQIISASVLQKTTNPNGTDSTVKGHIALSEPVMYTLEHITTNNVYNPTCSFWDYTERTMTGQWSSFGCKVHETNVTHTTCSCNHLTNFAVLMAVQAIPISDEHQFALSLITYLGCIISISCLVICFVTFSIFKNLQCDRNTIHKNLVLCLLVAEILFLVGIMQHSKPIVCSVMAGLLHFFFLAAFMWMLMEGVQLYVMLVEVFEAERSRVKYYYLVSYGTPSIIVAISAAINHSGYGTETHCWLTTEGGFIWAFVGPVVVIISVNIVMLSIAIYQMCKHANAAAGWKMKQKSKMESIRSWVKGASVLVVLLGLTWTFGLLYINEHTMFMAYIFTILNSFQGLFIFIFHCAMNDKIQKEYKRWLRRATWVPEPIRVKYAGAKPYNSTSPNQSSSSGNKGQSQKTTKTKYGSDPRVSLEYLTKLLSGRRRKRSSTTTVPSTVSNGSRWHYQNMKKDQRDSGISDSGIVRNSDSLLQSEDQGGYLEPVNIRLKDETLLGIDDDPGFSLMEGSCVDSECYGIPDYKKTTLDVDKYKIKAVMRSDPICELDADFCSNHDYEEIPATESELRDSLASEGYHSMLRQKLEYYAAEKERNAPRDVPNMNNLDKGDNGNVKLRDSVLLNTPNIHFPHQEAQSLPDPNRLPVVIEKLNKDSSASDEGLMTIHRNTDKRLNDMNILPGARSSSNC